MYIIVAGAGMIGRRITDILIKKKHDVVVIELKQDICESLYSATGAVTVQGNATDISVLKEAGGSKADVILTMMGNDADNIACALLAKSLEVPRIISRLKNPLYEDAYKLAGVSAIVREAELLLNQITTEVEQTEVKKIMSIGGGKASIYSMTIPEKASSIGMEIKDITSQKGFPTDCVFMGIYKEKDDDFMIPRGHHTIDKNDTVFLIAASQDIHKASDFLSKE
jgi:trk system potassium uptake protein TrkA